LVHVPAEKLAEAWKSIKPGVEHVSSRFGERIIAEDVYHAIKSAQAWLFTIAGDVGFIVLRKSYEMTGEPNLFVWLIYGKPHRLKALEQDIYQELAEMAKNAGCARLQFWSQRKGWQQRGWKLSHYVYEKEV
jgi:hypothetical protein